MPLDFLNINTLWSSILVETLYRLGLTTAIISPGSRSAPLAIAFAQHKNIETIPILDERSAAFFGLGIARQIHKPVVIICTSGTATANFYPALIEAKESRVPLIFLTADRPPELRHCHSGQTIDQVKMYGNYPNWQIDLGLPEISKLTYLRQMVINSWNIAVNPTAGPVHINIPFRNPLAPIAQKEIQEIESHFPHNFFDHIFPIIPLDHHASAQFSSLIQHFLKIEKGLIIAGTCQPANPELYCCAISQLAHLLKFPIIADVLSPIRNYQKLNSNLITSYDLILRNHHLSEKLKPDIIIQIGDLPTSKELRNWLEKINVERWVIDQSYDNLDSLHGPTNHLKLSIETIINAPILNNIKTKTKELSNYLNWWCEIEEKVKNNIQEKMSAINQIIEPKVPWLISQILPNKTPVFIANSMPVRDCEFFWQINNLEIQPFFNRGANGIDGTLSTALGIAHRQPSSVLLTGDLSLLHDTNGFLITNKFVGHLTIILINNNGGGIFEMLPIAKYDLPFEEYFATPQNIDFSQLAQTYHIDYELIDDWQVLKSRLNPLPKQGVRILELKTNRHHDAQWRLENLPIFASLKN